MIKWKTLSRQTAFSARPWIEISTETVEISDGRIIDDYHQIWITDYVMVFAETAAGEVILERQYKHGVRDITLTFPTGAIEANEAPLAAAQRELLEETGHTSADWRHLQTLVVQGNYGCGKAHFFLAKNAQKTATPLNNDLEDIHLEWHPRENLLSLIASGELALLDCVAMVLLATQQP